MKLLEKVVAAGYKVTDHKNEKGSRFVTITSPDCSAWTRTVFFYYDPLALVKCKMQFLIARCRNYIANPVK